jgi:hypothetical protein
MRVTGQGIASTACSHISPKTGKPAGIGPPANQWESEMKHHLVFLPLIIVICDIKVKITWKLIIQKR